MLDFDNLFDFDELFNSFDWDKKSYKFNRDEKDMHPYSIINNKKETIIVHNVLGKDKKDLKISLKKESGNTYILIEGKSMKEVSRFVFDKLATLDSVSSTATHFVLKKYKDHGTKLVDTKKDPREQGNI